jgi:hypothetical protein
MNIGAMITLMKIIEGAGLTKRAPQDPSSKAGMRPKCGIGEKAILQNDQWICVLKFK